MFENIKGIQKVQLQTVYTVYFFVLIYGKPLKQFVFSTNDP